MSVLPHAKHGSKSFPPDEQRLRLLHEHEVFAASIQVRLRFLQRIKPFELAIYPLNLPLALLPGRENAGRSSSPHGIELLPFAWPWGEDLGHQSLRLGHIKAWQVVRLGGFC